MPRVNLSIDEDLFKSLEKDATVHNSTVNVHIISILEGLYKQYSFDYQAALNKLIDEAKLKTDGKDFTLFELPSFSDICVSKAEDANVKPSIVRARLGKMFCSCVKKGIIKGVERQTIIKNNKEELKFRSRAAVYIIKKNNEKNDGEQNKGDMK